MNVVSHQPIRGQGDTERGPGRLARRSEASPAGRQAVREPGPPGPLNATTRLTAIPAGSAPSTGSLNWAVIVWQRSATERNLEVRGRTRGGLAAVPAALSIALVVAYYQFAPMSCPDRWPPSARAACDWR